MIELAPGAEQNGLARWFAHRIAENLANARARTAFAGMHATVAVVPDQATSTLTLRFDFGRVTVHPGLLGRPELTISGNRREIERLAELPFAMPWRLPVAMAQSQTRRALFEVGRALRTRRLRIYGLVTHPLLVLKVIALISQSTY